MTTPPRSDDRAVFWAAFCALAMIAQQVGSKATRDAVFLSQYDVTALPYMVIGAAFVSFFVVLIATRDLSRQGPARLVSPAFAFSAVLYLIEAFLLSRVPKVAAVLIYLHVASLGAVLISAFWSLINERFDPRTARRRIARITAAGTLGGLLGGLIADLVGSRLEVVVMLPVLAALHLICAVVVRGALPPHRAQAASTDEDKTKGDIRLGLEVLNRVGYLRHMAIVVVLGAVGAALIDYVFKAAAAGTYQEAALLSFFARFYTIVGLATLLIQAALGRWMLAKLGPAHTVMVLPLYILAGSIGGLVWPGLPTMTLFRGGQSALQSSIFRTGYELLYIPIAPREKRATKTLVDVGFDRLGDAMGGGFVRLVLMLVPAAATSTILVAVGALGLVGAYFARLLQRGYVRALERSLLRQAVEGELPDVFTSTTLSLSDTSLTDVRLDKALAEQSLVDMPVLSTFEGVTFHETTPATGPPAAGLETPAPTSAGSKPGSVATSHAVSSSGAVRPVPGGLDPDLERIQHLRSGDADLVRRELRREPVLPATLVYYVVMLLAWDEAHRAAIRALRTVADQVPGQLLDSLLDPKEEFAIRRRIPRVLAVVDDQRVVDGLFLGLGDRRFEVRYQCGRALATIFDRDRDGLLEFARDRVYVAVSNEVAVDKKVWEGQRLLDRADEEPASVDPEKSSDDRHPFLDEFIRYRSNRSMQHVFTLLSLVLPKEPLKVAYQGLHTDDQSLRGTALEYLESVLPGGIRQSLWPFIEDHRPERTEDKPQDTALEALLRSQASIELNLKELQQKLRDSGQD